MIYILHGQDTRGSRQKLNQIISEQKTKNILRLTSKTATEEQINLFLNTSSLFSDSRLLVIENFFSISKANLDKIIKLIQANQSDSIILYQDKDLTQAQLASFTKAKIQNFPAPKGIWLCINSLKPGNSKVFLQSYEQMLLHDPFELFFYLLRQSLRKWLQQNSLFAETKLKSAYLHTIQLDYFIKTGQLVIPKELALKRILLSLIS